MKNFKKKFLSAMLACLMLSPCAASFASCDNGSGNPSDPGNAGAQHEHTWSANFSYNDSKHYKICSGCNEKSEEGEHTYGADGYTCTVCGYENEARKPAQKQSAADVFGGVKVSYAREKIVDADGTEKSFNEILDRQIDLLAQDILYRLNYVYGTDGTSNYTRPTDNYDLNYNFGDKKALIKPATILAEINAEHTENHSDTVVQANCLKCFQSAVVSTSNHSLNKQNSIILVGAIQGYYTSLENETNVLQNIAVHNNGWNYYNKFSDIQSSIAKTHFKYGIAKILAKDLASSTNYNEAEYTKILNKITHLGFNPDIKSDLETFIYNEIIGNQIATKDLSFFNSNYFDKNGYTINANFIMKAPYPGNTAYSEAENAASPRLYKGYNIVVPAIVERAIENTFDGSEISLYPAMNRYAVQSFDNLNAFANEAQAYESIVLMPKAEISATKLALKIKGANNIGVKCEINGEAVQVAASKDGELILIDLHAYAKKIGVYNGGKENDFSLDLFGNSGAGAAGINNGEHYIKLIFENPNGGKFSVEIDGYYNK